jgi:Domain of unknown function (DUF4367)
MKEMDFETQLRSIATGMEYPRTPDIAGSVSARLRQSIRPRLLSKPFVFAKGRRLAWSLTLALILLSSLMLIPPARAAILEFIQIGVIRIFRAEPTPIVTTEPSSSIQSPVTATPALTPQILIPWLETIAGEVTLEEAQASVGYPVLLPALPADLGQPDRVFVQDADGPMTFLIWFDPVEPDEILMSLHFLPPDSWAIKKVEPVVIQETTVNGNYAVWTVGPYPMRYKSGDLEYRRMIDGHVLIWTDGNITYRLETDLSLEEAIKIAESLEPIP